MTKISATTATATTTELRLIPDDQLEFNPIYISQKSPKTLLKALFDQSKLICSSTEKLSCFSYDSIKSGLVERDGGLDQSVSSLDVYQTNAITTDTSECKIYKTKPLKLLRTVDRKVGLRIARVSGSGLIAMGSDDADILIGCCLRPDYRKVLKGHTNAVVGLGFDPSSLILVSVGSDGLVKVWSRVAGFIALIIG
jgi:WD40 repeat protein